MSERPNPGKLERGALVGLWEVVGRIGDGGYGYIYKVRRDGRLYALKIARQRQAELPAADRGASEERFHREVSALMGLHHPNIVRIRAFDRWPDAEEGYPYLVMDYVEGAGPREWREEARPSLAQICQVFEKIAGALGHMHRLGIAHRDLKNENIIVRADGEPILVDFGLARPERAYAVTQASGIGTLTHLAPEYITYCDSRAWGREPFAWSPSVDIYALGCVLYATLAGETPIILVDEEGKPLGEAQVIERIKNERPDPPSAANPAIAVSLDAVVLRLLEKDPAQRPQSAEEVADLLRHARSEAGRAWEVPLADVEDGTVPEPAGEGAGAVPAVQEPLPRVGASPVAPEQGAGDSVVATVAARTFREPTAVRQPPFVDEGGGRERPPQRGPFDPISAKEWDAAAGLVARDPGRRRPRAALLAGGGALALALVVALVLSSRAPVPAGEPKVLLSSRPEAGESVTLDAQRAAEPTRPPQLPPPVERVASASSPPPGAGPGLSADQERAGPRRAPKRSGASKEEPELPPLLRSQSIASSPILAQTVRLGAEKAATPTGPRTLGVPLGTHIQARLLTNLDTRTIGGGPVEAEVRAPVVVRGETVVPARSRVYGTASEGTGRFNLRFTQLRLPDDSVVPFEGIAYSREEGKPGLAADRRMEGPPPRSQGLGSRIAKGTGNILLDTITGGTAHDIARSAGQTALTHEEAAPAASGAVLLLDAGVDLSIFVIHPF